MARPCTRAIISRKQPLFALELTPTLPHHCARIQKVALVAVIGSRGYVQHHNLPYQPPFRSPSPPSLGREEEHNIEENVHIVDTDTSMLVYCMPEGPEGDNNMSCTRCRWVVQWTRWQEDFIPVAIQPFMELWETTESLRLSPMHPDRYNCKCEQGHTLQVNCRLF